MEDLGEGQLLKEREVSEVTGLTAPQLWHMRKRMAGIPFLKFGEGRRGNVRYRQEDVDAWLLEHPKRPGKARPVKPAAQVREIIVMKEIEAVTMSCEEASRRHSGIPVTLFRKMCLRGYAMTKRYRGKGNVPDKVARSVLFAQKVGRAWQIPLSELDRVFLGSHR
ncbi:hypothetical protein L4X63_20415 [Geomonas sp. Red32]|uniref:helix-turn-helix transcriptional regulator n=1 Tax=Geomonas sp. Red32 TaxID=2912856 RepID=UPI00202CEE9E|nr:hypothetical protein [Geomonas sp. Red32]MCM0083950.1 hypothetical protein [Geomonas sp. Red32]